MTTPSWAAQRMLNSTPSFSEREIFSRAAQAIEEADHRRRVRTSLEAWARHKGFEPAKHHRLIINAIEEFLADPELDILCLFAPPGSAKSTYTSVLFSSYFLARWPNRIILSATHSGDLAATWGGRVRDDILLDGPTLGLTLSPSSRAKERWSTTEGGEYYAVGADKGIGGIRSDLGLMDDLFGKLSDAMSEVIREARWRWVLNDFNARLKPRAKRILMNTRWHLGDPAGRILDQIEAGVIRGKVVTLRARAEADDPLGRKIGEYLWDDPGGYDYGSFLRQREKEYEGQPDMWEALYQQRPIAESGGYFKADWIREVNSLPPKSEMTFYGASDYAVTSNGGDWTVHVVVGVDSEERMFLVDLWRGQASSNIWVDTQIEMLKTWKPYAWAEEHGQIEAGVGPFRDAECHKAGAWTVFELFPTRGDKSIRAQSIRGRMAMRGLYVLRGSPWLKTFRTELLTFPKGNNDDQVDAMGLLGQLLDKVIAGTKKKPPEKKERTGYQSYQQERSSEGYVTLI